MGRETKRLTKQAILAADDLKIEMLEVPEWGGVVYVRVITGRERDAFEASMLSNKGKVSNLVDFRARFAALVLCDVQGKPLFTPADVVKLTKKSAAALDRVYELGMRLNAMGETDVEEMVGNSGGGQSAELGSA